MDFSKLARDFQHQHVERPLRSWGQHEEAFITLLKEVYAQGREDEREAHIYSRSMWDA